jgi:hypothetical protein
MRPWLPLLAAPRLLPLPDTDPDSNDVEPPFGAALLYYGSVLVAKQGGVVLRRMEDIDDAQIHAIYDVDDHHRLKRHAVEVRPYVISLSSAEGHVAKALATTLDAVGKGVGCPCQAR